jgi:hypothetical protein
MTNNELTRATLSKRQTTSLLKLKDRADASPNPNLTIKVTHAQLAAMRKAYLALVASGAEISEEVQQSAKNIGLI